MESAVIGLCYRPFPLLHHPKGLSSSSSKLLLFHHQQQKHNTLLFNHASLCASHHFPATLNPNFVATMSSSSSSSFPHENCITNKRLSSSSLPSNNSDHQESSEAASNNKRVLMRGVTGISFVLACVVGLINLNCKMNPMFIKTAYALDLPGAKSALKSLLETFTTKDVQPKPPQKNNKSDQLGEDEVKKLKLYAVGLSKSNPKKAKEILRNEYDEKKTWDENFNVKMALVELLIVQGEFREAREELDEFIRKKYNTVDHKQIIEALNDPTQLFDKSRLAQMVLYKFIIETMLKNKEEANKWLESFLTLLEEDDSIDSMMSDDKQD